MHWMTSCRRCVTLSCLLGARLLHTCIWHARCAACAQCEAHRHNHACRPAPRARMCACVPALPRAAQLQPATAICTAVYQVCRRAERSVVPLVRDEQVDSEVCVAAAPCLPACLPVPSLCAVPSLCCSPLMVSQWHHFQPCNTSTRHVLVQLPFLCCAS
jgi:hypothetical protein